VNFFEAAARWLDRSAGGILLGLALGAAITWLVTRHARKARCYYADWIEQYRGEARLVAIVAKERQLWEAQENERRAAELIEADRNAHSPEDA